MALPVFFLPRLRHALHGLARMSALFASVMLITSLAANAAVLTVTNTSDAGVGSLRAAVAAAVPGDTVSLATITGTIVLTSPIAIAKTLTINGPGANLLAISGGNAVQIFLVSSAVVITGVTLANGTASGTAIQGIAPPLRGGAIANSGNLTLDAVALRGNTAFDGGGAIYNLSSGVGSGVLTIRNSELSGNTVTDVSGIGGGAILSDSSIGSAASITIINSTVSGNSANASVLGMGGGGIMFSSGTLRVISSTIAANRAGTAGGNIHQATVAGTTLSLRNSIISGGVVDAAGVLSADLDIFQPAGAAITSLGYNIVQNRSAASSYAVTDAVNGTSPLLAALAANGGPTQTMRPGVSSLAYAFVPAAACLDEAGVALTNDQRGVPRLAPLVTTCDAGSVEQVRLNITTNLLNNGVINTPYSQTLIASGGLPPQVWSAISGALPPGVSLSSGGTLSGTPTSVGTFTFTVQVVDQTGTVMTRTYSITLQPALRAITDLSGDGKSDLLIQSGPNGTISAYLMNGTSITTAAGLIGGGAGWSVSRTADLNGDGRADILWRHTDGTVVVWLMNGTAIIGGGPVLGAGSGWSVTHTADLNGDGRADILWRHTDGTVAVWLMDGTTIIGGGTVLGAGSGWSVTHTADLNGDGRADILWRHTDGTVAVWLMSGATIIGGGNVLGAGSGWSVARIGDFNGDGKADLVWRHSDGTIVIWLMDGITLLGGGAVVGAGTTLVVP